MAYERKTYDLFISDEFRKVLDEIKSDSVVAQLLLKKRHDKEELADDPVNFISVSTQDSSRISYLTTERMCQIEESEFWTSSRRFHVKPGGFISKVFKNVSPKDVEIFSNLFRVESRKPKFTFKVVSGEDIRKYYHHSYHASDYGSLGVSCMRYDSCQKMMDMYVENPDKISMIIMFNDEDAIMGRSLLWNFDGNKIMDRIYTINDEQLPFYFKKWATDNDYLFRCQQNWYNSMNFQNLNVEKKFLKLEVKLENFDFRYYPYLDTFRFYSPGSGTFSNFKPKGRDYYTLCSSDGGTYSYDYLVFDDVDKYFRHRGDTVYLDYLNITTNPNNCNYSDIHDCHILNEHSEWRDDIRDYIYIGEYSHLNDNSSIEERIRLNKEHEETRRSRRRSSQPEVSLLMSELERIGMDYFTLRNNIEVEREDTREQATDELT
jgi:hypothetical protein